MLPVIAADPSIALRFVSAWNRSPSFLSDKQRATMVGTKLKPWLTASPAQVLAMREHFEVLFGANAFAPEMLFDEAVAGSSRDRDKAAPVGAEECLLQVPRGARPGGRPGLVPRWSFARSSAPWLAPCPCSVPTLRGERQGERWAAHGPHTARRPAQGDEACLHLPRCRPVHGPGGEVFVRMRAL